MLPPRISVERNSRMDTFLGTHPTNTNEIMSIQVDITIKPNLH